MSLTESWEKNNTFYNNYIWVKTTDTGTPVSYYFLMSRLEQENLPFHQRNPSQREVKDMKA